VGLSDRRRTLDARRDAVPTPRATVIHTDQYKVYARLPSWDCRRQTVRDSRGVYARDEDGGGFGEVRIGTMAGIRSVPRS
jgi:transposase